jgi:hypothetical protein
MMSATRQRYESSRPIGHQSAWPRVQPKLMVGAPSDRLESEADRAADAVVNGTPVRIGPASTRTVRRDPPAAPPQAGGYGEGLQKLGEAFLKTQVGKQLVEAAERLGKDFIATLPGKIITGTAAAAAVGELAREHKALPAQPPAVPLDFITPGLKAQLRVEGPIDHPSAASISFSIPLGRPSAPTSAARPPSASATYRAQTERMRADLEKWRPRTADDHAMDAYTQQRLQEATERLIPGLRPRPASAAPPERKEEEGPIRRKADSGEGGSFAAPAAVEGILASGGERLPPGVESSMSARFGRDFSGVRVHADDRAADSTSAIAARAYTYGDHIVFGRGQYAPARQNGQWLLAHELAHVAQQSRLPAAGATPVPALTAAPRHVSRKCCEACEDEAQTLRAKRDEAQTLRAKRDETQNAGDGNEAPGIVQDVLRTPGRPLDASVRAYFEPRFGRDFSQVQVYADAQASASTRAVGARAYTVGSKIAFGAGEWSPGTAAGRRLLAHELAHVAQAQPARAPVLRRKEPDSPTGGPPTAVGMSVSMNGLHFDVPATMTYAAGRRTPQLLAIVLKRLLGDAYKPGWEPAIETELDKAKLTRFGGFKQPGTAKVGEAVGPIQMGLGAALIVLDFLSAKKITTVLTDQQIELLQLGLSSFLLWEDFKATLAEDELPLPSWYSVQLFQQELASRATLLRSYTAALAQQGDKPDEARVAKLGVMGDLVSLLYRPIEVMEAVRRDLKLANDPKTTGAYVALWHIPKGTKQPLTQTPSGIREGATASLFLAYQHTQEQLATDSLTDPEARSELMRRFEGFLGRTTLTASGSKGDQQLREQPGTANAGAFPSTLTPVPDVPPPLFNAALGTDHRFGMNVEFPSVYEALGRYAFNWELVRVPDEKIGTPVDVTKLKGEKVGNFDVAAVRFSRDVAYAETDIKRTIESTRSDLGPPGAGAIELVAANAILRFLGTGLKLAFDILTMPSEQKLIVFPSPGLYIVRAAMSQILLGDEAVVRVPSVAYYPVLAREPDEMAQAGVKAEVSAREKTEERIKALEKQLAGPMRDADRTAARQELDALKASLAPLGDRLEARRKKAAELEQAIESGKQPGDLEAATKQREAQKKIIALRAKRGIEGEVLTARFVSDLGQTVPLTMEIVDRKAPKGSFSIYLSDLTTPKSGDATGTGKSRDDAIVDAVRDVLESIHGYGRGRVAVSLESGVRTIRIDAGQGALLMEAVQNVSTALSVAAIAAAPFTGGASLSFLVPLGLIGAVPSAYRIIERWEAGTFELDLENLLDIVNVAGSLIGIGRMAAGSLGAVRLGRTLLVIGFGVDAAGGVLMGAQLLQQINDLSKLPPGERASALMMLIGQTMMTAGVMAGGALAQHGEQVRAEETAAAKRVATEGPHEGTGEPHAPPPKPGPDTAERARVDSEMAKLGEMDAHSEERLRADENLRKALNDEPLAAAALKKCSSDCFPPEMTAAQVRRLGKLLDEVAKTGAFDEAALKEYLYGRRGDLDAAITDIAGATDARDLNAHLDAANRSRKGGADVPPAKPPPRPGTAAPTRFEPGARVTHPQFGDGTVITTREGKVTVAFDTGGEKVVIGDRLAPTDRPAPPRDPAAEKAARERTRASDAAARSDTETTISTNREHLNATYAEIRAKTRELQRRKARGEPIRGLDEQIKALGEEAARRLEAEARMTEALGQANMPLYEKARAASPSTTAREAVLKRAGYRDELSGKASSELEADHTVPLSDIVNMKGFDELDWASQREILNRLDNLVSMDGPANRSKGAQSWHEWLENNPYDQATRERMRTKEDWLRGDIQRDIFERLGGGSRK